IKSNKYEMMLYSLYLEEGVLYKIINKIKNYLQCIKQNYSCNANCILVSSY
ncbi:hypothetical protein M406DRAFT_256818, partial [Cryphonectria parasitica EP155]